MGPGPSPPCAVEADGVHTLALSPAAMRAADGPLYLPRYRKDPAKRHPCVHCGRRRPVSEVTTHDGRTSHLRADSCEDGCEFFAIFG